MLFKKKEKPLDKKQGKVKKKKYKEALASAVDESSVSQAVSVMQGNTSFKHTSDKGEDLYICAYINVDDIGGLSQKTNKDESKGHLVLAIRNGQILTYVTPEFLEEEKLLFIPNPETLERMGEYSMLYDPELSYHLVDVNSEGVITELEAECKFSDLKEISKNGVVEFLNPNEDDSVKRALAQEASTEVYEQNFDNVMNKIDVELQQEPEESYELTELVENEEVYPDLEYGGVENEYYEPIQDNEMAELEPVPTNVALEPSDIEDTNEYNEYLSSEDMAFVNDIDETDIVSDDIVLSKEESTNNLKVLKTGKDMSVTIDLSEFEDVFSKLSIGVFDDSTGEGWLDEQINNISKQANADLKRLKNNHYELLKVAYVNDLVKKSSDITKEVYSEYNDKFKELDDNKMEAINELNSDSGKLRKKLTSEFEDEAEEYAETAKRMAKAKYKSQNKYRFANEVAQAVKIEKKKIEDSYFKEIKDLKNERDNCIVERFNKTKADTITSLFEIRNAQYEIECEAFNKWNDIIRNYLDEYRKNDIAKTELRGKEIEEGARIRSAVDSCRSEYDAKMKQYQFDMDELRKKIDHLNSDYESQLMKKDSTWNARVEELTTKNKDLELSMDKLFKNYENLSKAKDEEYKLKIESLVDERKLWESKFDSAIKMSKKMTAAIAVGVLISIVTAVLAGYVLGSKSVETPKEKSPYVINVTSGDQK